MLELTLSARSRLWLSALVGLLSLAIGLAACTATDTPSATLTPEAELRYGDSFTNVSAEREHYYTFEGHTGEIITIRIVGGVLAVLLNPQGQQIARVPTNTGRLENYQLPSAGRYSIITSVDRSKTFDLFLEHNIISNSTPTSLATSTTLLHSEQLLKVGQVYRGVITATEPLGAWQLDAKTGEVITLRAKAISSEVQPYLRLFGPDQALLVEVTTKADAEAVLNGYVVPADGSYLVQVGGGGYFGAYTITLLSEALTPTPPLPTVVIGSVAPTPTITPTPTLVLPYRDGRLLEDGQIVQGQIFSGDQRDRYIVFGTAGTQLSIGMFATEQSGLIPQFILYAPDGDMVANISSLNGAILQGYTLPSTGAYILYASASSATLGPYTISVGSGFALRDIMRGSLQIETNVQGTIQRLGDRDIWMLDLPANATLTVEVAAFQSLLIPHIDVIGPDGNILLTANNETGTTQLLTAPATTQRSGQYRLRISGERGTSIGMYVLVIRVIAVVPTATFTLPLEEQREVAVEQGQFFTYYFQAASDTVMLVEGKGLSLGFDPIIEIYGPSGRRLFLADDLGQAQTQAVLQVALNDGVGTYAVRIYGYALMAGRFTFRIRLD